jgi:hypothetical protein
MKKLILFIICFVTLNNYLVSQLSVGFHGGFTIGNGEYQAMTVVPADVPVLGYKPSGTMFDLKTKSETSLTFGALAEVKIYSFLYLQAEFNVLDHKNRIPFTWVLFDNYTMGWEQFYSFDIHYSLKYIELPLSLKMKFGYNKFLPYCFAGAGIGYLYKTTEIVVANQQTTYWEFDVTNRTAKQQTFIIAGIGTEYILSDIFKIFTEIRYSNSLTDIAESPFIYFKPHNFNFLFGIKTNS